MNEQQLLAALAANPALMTALAAQVRQSEKASGVANAAIQPHGSYGLFNTPGVEPGVLSTLIQPLYGLQGLLESRGHIRRTQFENPLFGILTGQTASSGANATEGCDENVPVPGDLKMCHQTWTFGEITMKTKPIQMDRAGTLINRSEPLDLRLLNNPFGEVPQVVPGQSSTALFRSVVAKATIELMNAIRRDYCGLLYTGNPVNTAASTGSYIEYNGLDRIINTGYQDAITGTACSAADSYITSFNSAVAQSSPVTVVRTIVETYRNQRYLATQTNMNPVGFAFVGRYQAFLALTEIWPCAYETYRCYAQTPNGNAIVVDTSTADNNRLRDEMRSGMFFLIDGERVPFITDDCLSEANVGGGAFESDLYLLPLTSPVMTDTNGQITYLEYFDYNGPFGMQQMANELGYSATFTTSNDGRYAIARLAPTAFCAQVMVRTRLRLIVRAPFLAARLTDLRYNVYVHERSPFPGTSFYENGGNTSFVGAQYQSPV